MNTILLEGTSGDWFSIWLILIVFLVMVKLGHMLCVRIFRHLRKHGELTNDGTVDSTNDTLQEL